MKVVDASEMRRIEEDAYSKGASEEAFMNQAAVGVAEAAERLVAELHLKPNIILLAGPGNNGGDGYACSQILKSGGFHVRAFSFSPPDEGSSLCKLQRQRFLQMGGHVEYVTRGDTLDFTGASLIIDALFGSGFRGEAQGIFKEAIDLANHSHLPILSIDIPSGLNGTTGEATSAIKAQATLCLGLPKTGCFIGEGWNHVGKVATYNFGLDETYYDEAKATFLLLEEKRMRELFPRIQRTRHKYSRGYLVGVGGSKKMMGAPLLASLSALRSGCGIVRLFHPEGLDPVAAPLEIIRESYPPLDTAGIEKEMERATALFVGPGMGVEGECFELLKRLIPKIDKPVVFDADALSYFSENKSIPKNAILTPHVGEMKRLLGTDVTLKKVQEFVDSNNCFVCLKGAPTFIFSKDTLPRISPFGDPGMATAGCGDVLTGIIGSLLAQGLEPLQALELACYLHGKAGEIASSKKSSYAMIATDLIEMLPEVFLGTKRQIF